MTLIAVQAEACWEMANTGSVWHFNITLDITLPHLNYIFQYFIFLMHICVVPRTWKQHVRVLQNKTWHFVWINLSSFSLRKIQHKENKLNYELVMNVRVFQNHLDKIGFVERADSTGLWWVFIIMAVCLITEHFIGIFIECCLMTRMCKKRMSKNRKLFSKSAYSLTFRISECTSVNTPVDYNYQNTVRNHILIKHLKGQE